jgi:opacity protein-like surface antigen
MKRIIINLAIIILCIPAFRASAQDVPGPYIGARFMPTFSDFQLKQVNGDLVETKAVLGYGFGGLLGINLSNHFALQGEVLYSALAQNYLDNFNQEHRVNLDYLNIPLLVVLNTNSSSAVNLNLTAGPQFGILLGSKFESTGTAEGDTVTAVLGAKAADFGIAYGAGIDFSLGPVVTLDLGYRGVIGLVDISDQSQSITTDQFYILDRSHVMTYAAYAGLKFKF